MTQAALALYWHQHQPYYPDDVSGEVLMPWVRLHGVKDYYGMALHLWEVPEFRCTINLVPSLLVQIQRYTQGGSDRHLDVSRIPADSLSESDALYLLDQFFLANVESMIRPIPRYFELYQKRGAGKETAEQALPRFTLADLRDLQVLNNLTWVHPLAYEQDTDLRDIRNRGRGWTELEKNRLLDTHLDLLAKIIPLHKSLADRGQVELTTTPFYHPILPLVWDRRLARQALPECLLPRRLDGHPADARLQIERAVAFHRETFGRPPVGMWPSEGSVAQEIVAPISQAGIEWIASDEEILSSSTNGWISRDPQGHLRNPQLLYRPWRVDAQGRSLQIVFRDHGLSDLIGFHYQRTEPQRAATDLLARVEAIGRACEPHNAGRPAMVPVILDGENCWEYYPDGGVQFLRTLYRNACRQASLRPVQIGEFVREWPAADRIANLFAGSWISHNFAIWMGHAEDVAAWDLLDETRQFLVDAQVRGRVPQALLDGAWKEVHIAEGSDWFWWFGDDHSSAQDGLFDQLFRKHLANVYLLLGAPVPERLNRPIARLQRRVMHTQPRGFLQVKLDGKRTYFEWINAGHYVAGNERGTMTLVTEGLIREVFFGFDAERLMIRIDALRAAKAELAEMDELRIGFVEPKDWELRLSRPGRPDQVVELLRQGRPVAAEAAAAVDQIVEATIRFADLGLKPDAPIQFSVEVLAGGQSVDRAPREGTIELKVPGKDFELVMWQA